VLDQPFYAVFHPVPAGTQWGHAADLDPANNCTHFTAEVLHARIDYKPEHWVRVDVIVKPVLSENDISRLRVQHLNCLRQQANCPDYGANC
jgi:hypothetical protein